MENISIYLKLAEDYLKEDNFLAAITCYQKVIEIQPQSEQIYLIIGDIFVKLQQYDQAIVNYKKAKQLNPKLPFINKKIAQTLEKKAEIIKQYLLNFHLEGLKNDPFKLIHYHKSLEFQPHNLDLYLGLVNSLIHHQKFDEAIVICQVALIIEPAALIFAKKIETILHHNWPE